MRRPNGFQTTVGVALGLSVAASMAASWDGPPTDYEMLCLLVAFFGAFSAGIVTAPVERARVYYSPPVLALPTETPKKSWTLNR
jgi:hypothetical protein